MHNEMDADVHLKTRTEILMSGDLKGAINRAKGDLSQVQKKIDSGKYSGGALKDLRGQAKTLKETIALYSRMK